MMKSTILQVCIIGSWISIGFATTSSSENLNLVKNGQCDSMRNWEVPRHPEIGEVSVEFDGAKEEQFFRIRPLNSAYPEIFAVQQSFVPPPEEGAYTLRCRMRISEDYAAAMPCVAVNVFKSGDAPVTDNPYHEIFQLPLSKDAVPGKWTKLEKEFTIPKNCPRVYVQLMAFGSMGNADFDDIEIVPTAAKGVK
ncbi:MAG: hypothetical protein HY360_04460 [Verrucomicrobia bacterium]|nr:hypothetical protein [Verrucomicrobiota bacterium]